MVTARMTVVNITGEGETKQIDFECIYDGSDPTDESFNRYTPSGKMTLHVSNPAAIEQLTLGTKFDITMSPVLPKS
jgi:hypothetical protein